MDIKKAIQQRKELKTFNSTYQSNVKLTESQKIKAMHDYEKINELVKLFYSLNSDNYLDKKMQDIIQEYIIAVISKNPNAMYIEPIKTRETIGLLALKWGLYNVVKHILADKTGATIKDDYGNNLGANCALAHKEDLVIESLKNPYARTQKCMWGRTIGMFAAEECLHHATEKALTYPDASIQQNCNGHNIGMICAMKIKDDRRMANLVSIAFQNPIARSQKSLKGDTIESLSKQNNYDTDLLYDIETIGNIDIDRQLIAFRNELEEKFNIQLSN